MLGSTLHTINLRLSAEQIAYTINRTGDDVIIVNRAVAGLLAQVKDQVRDVDIIVCGRGQEYGLKAVGDLEELIAESDAEFKFSEVDEDCRATLFFTTGTTGVPKGVYFSNWQLVLHTLAGGQALSSAQHGNFRPSDVYMPITPMFHVHAWGVPYLARMIGCTQVYPGRYEPNLLIDLIENHKVTLTHCVPTIMQMLLEVEKLRKGALNGVSMIIGGAALPRALAKAGLEVGMDVYSGYGMSETCAILCLAQLNPEEVNLSLDEQFPLRTMTGRPTPMVDLKVVDEDMNEVAHDGISQGEIVVQAPWLMPGYLGDEEASKELWHGGWLPWGDIVPFNVGFL